MNFILEVDKLKQITRQSYITGGERKETDTDHSWHLAMMCALLSEYANEEIDVTKTMIMVLIHDIVEIDAGDTYAYDADGNQTKRDREVKAADRIFNLLPKDQAKEMRALWEEFEAQDTAEARFANALDKIQPILLNDATGGLAWREHEVEKSQIMSRNERTPEGSKALWSYAKEIIERNLGTNIIDEDADPLEERWNLAMIRIREMETEKTVPVPFYDYFQRTAGFLMQMKELREMLNGEDSPALSIQEWQQLNHQLYKDILPEQYETSYGNPAFAAKMLGAEQGKLLGFLYTELRGLIGYLFEGRLQEAVVHLELFIEIYNAFEQQSVPSYKEIQQILYWFVSDYSDVFVTERIRESVDPARNFAVNIIMNSDLTDMTYLYRYGEYVTDNELQTAAFLNSLSEEEIQAMADTYTEGYRIGFAHGGKDLSRKMTVNIRYHLGFERMLRSAIYNFEKMGLKPVVSRYALSTVNKRSSMRLGYTGAVPNQQFDYDHREDAAIYLDKKFVERRLGVMRSAYETFKTLANGHAGPAVVEVFGEKPFTPAAKEEACQLSERQQQLMVSMNNSVTQLTNQYIIGKERSFTIIAFPVPEIGPDFQKIFRETVKINTLDYHLYERIQQTIIDTLDLRKSVHIQGKNGNRTDLTVALHPLNMPGKETIFENCVADVNIPVGEVFTSPQLSGTNGVLHVKQVYLNGLKYLDLCITFTDGMITDYSCSNFDTAEENRNFIQANLLYHHDTLPIGEFAIGTNTTAYAMAQKYQIAEKLPILIAEKMGPHFAVGDTCYSWEEDTPVYNPDGKEIIARDNAVSLLRREDPAKAYFGCHTDITIPYEELGSLEVIHADGSRQEIIGDGRFTLAGTEELNIPLKKL